MRYILIIIGVPIHILMRYSEWITKGLQWANDKIIDQLTNNNK